MRVADDNMPRVFWREVRGRGLFPDWEQVIKEVESTLDGPVKRILLGAHTRIVSHWSEESQPAFRARKRITRQFIAVYVYPHGPNKQIWQWVSVTGTKPHDITPVDAEYLWFKWDGPGSYDPHTTVAGDYEGTGLATGPLRRFGYVQHPGYPPRHFETHIAKWCRPQVNRLVENAFRRGIRKARARSR